MFGFTASDLRIADPHRPNLEDFIDALADRLVPDANPKVDPPTPSERKFTIPGARNRCALTCSKHSANSIRVPYVFFGVCAFFSLPEYFAIWNLLGPMHLLYDRPSTIDKSDCA